MSWNKREEERERESGFPLGRTGSECSAASCSLQRVLAAVTEPAFTSLKTRTWWLLGFFFLFIYTFFSNFQKMYSIKKICLSFGQQLFLVFRCIGLSFSILFIVYGEVEKMMQHPFYPFSRVSLLEKKVKRSSLCMCGTIENEKKKNP